MTGQPELKPTLGLYSTIAIVVGAVIGSGIFISPGGMARIVPSGPSMLIIWLVAGILTLVGALTQCELCSSMPRTGGLYVYLKEAFGEGVAFYYGWANFMIAGSGAVAAISFIFASYLNEFIPLWHPPLAWQEFYVAIPFLGRLLPFADLGEKLVGCGLIVVLTGINSRGVRLGAGLQSVSSSLKVLALGGIVIVGLSFAGGDWSHVFQSRPTTTSLSEWKLIGLAVTALSGAFWAYDGWGNLAYIAGEVKRPERTIPVALITGTCLVVTLYLLVNLVYLYVFPIEALGNLPGDRVASALMGRALGPWGAQAVALIILLSTFDTTNSGILTNARVYFAMAREKVFPAVAGSVHPKYGTPYVALWMQCAWTCVLLVSGSFDLVISMYVWVNWLFYLLMAIAVFRCRQRRLPRTFTIWGYPYLPLIFTAFTLFYLVMTLSEDVLAFRAGEVPNVKSLMGLALVLAGTPFYWWMRRRSPLVGP